MFFTSKWMTLCCCHDVFHDLVILSWHFFSSFCEQNIIFWRHDELFNVMVCSLLQSEFVVMMTYFITCLYCPDMFFIILRTKYYENVFLMSLTLWYIFYIMLNVWHHDKPFVIMPCFWLTFWRHGKFVDVICFWHHDELFWNTCRRYDVFDVIANLSMLWHVLDFMTHCFDIYLMSWQILWCHGVFLMSLTCFDVFVTSWLTFWSILHSLTSWRTFWCHGSFDNMTHFLRPDARHVFYIMTNLFVVMTYFCHYFGNKILCKCDFDIMTTFLMLWHALMSRQNIWCHDVCLTSWQTVWRRGIFFTLGQTAYIMTYIDFMTFWPHD